MEAMPVLMDDMTIFLSDKPFVKYETARFDGGIYRTDDEEEIALLMKSRYYGKGFRRIDDIAPGLVKSKNEFNPYEEDSIAGDLQAVVERENKEAQDIVEEFKDARIAYDAMEWGDLRKHAKMRNVSVYKKNRVEIINELEKLDGNSINDESR